MSPENPLHFNNGNNFLGLFVVGAGKFGDDSINADELTNDLLFLDKIPEIKAVTGDGQEFEVQVVSATNSPGLTPALGQLNLTFSDEFWVLVCDDQNTTIEFDITVTDTKTGSTRTYGNALGQTFKPITDTQAFATCP